MKTSNFQKRIINLITGHEEWPDSKSQLNWPDS